jgi:hypothetical protein
MTKYCAPVRHVESAQTARRAPQGHGSNVSRTSKMVCARLRDAHAVCVRRYREARARRAASYPWEVSARGNRRALRRGLIFVTTGGQHYAQKSLYRNSCSVSGADMAVDLDEYARLGIPAPLRAPEESLQALAESSVDSIAVDKPLEAVDEWRPKSRRAKYRRAESLSDTSSSGPDDAGPRRGRSVARQIRDRMVLASMTLALLGAWAWLPHDPSELASVASPDSAEASQGAVASAQTPAAITYAPPNAGLPSWLSREILFATPVVRASTTPAAAVAAREPR